MTMFTIRYGYCEATSKNSVFDQLLQHPHILKVKSIAGIKHYCVFAILLDVKVLNFATAINDMYLVSTPILTKPESRRFGQLRKEKKTKKEEPKVALSQSSPLPLLSRKHFNHLDELQIQACKRDYRALRRKRNQILTPENWNQHINKKAAKQAISALLEEESKTTPFFFLARGASITPYSVSR